MKSPKSTSEHEQKPAPKPQPTSPPPGPPRGPNTTAGFDDERGPDPKSRPNNPGIIQLPPLPPGVPTTTTLPAGMTSKSYNSFTDILPSSRGYYLSDVRLNIPNPATAIFKAKLNGPAGHPVWARAWLSTEAGTLAESASSQLKAGDEITLEVILRSQESPQYAYMRIESAPLKTEHVVVLKFM